MNQQSENAMSAEVETNVDASVSRRFLFIKVALVSGAFGAVAALPLLSLSAKAASSDGEKEILTGSHWGAFYAKVQDGRITGIRPREKEPRPLPMLSGVADVVSSPTRIRYPMVRRAWLEHGLGADPAGRGTDDFVRVSWVKVLDLVANELARVRKAHGPSAIFGGSIGWKSVGKLHSASGLLHRETVNGGFLGHNGDYSTGAAQVILPYVIGSMTVYEQPTVWPVVAEHSEVLVFSGSDLYVTNQIGWMVPDHGGYSGMEMVKKRGVKVICIDPVRTETCDYFGAEWLAPRPQTDVAMMLGIAHTLYAEKLHNEAFLAKYTTGFDRFLSYLTGQSDGVVKNAEWASRLCDIPADAIKPLARLFASKRTMLASGWSTQRAHHGKQAPWMIVTLASMLGQIGLPGGGYGFSYHYSGGGTPLATSPVLASATASFGRLWPKEAGPKRGRGQILVGSG